MLLSVLVVLLTACVATFGFSCSERQFLHNNICCDKCWPNQKVVQNCTALNNTVCDLCEPGTFMKDYNEKPVCDSCPRHYYYDNDLLFCMKCRPCPAGQYPVKICVKAQKTECEECPKNHFSNITENLNASCIPCTKCKTYKRMCSKKMDALCDKVHTTTLSTIPSTPPSTKRNTALRDKTTARIGVTNESKPSQDILIIVISLSVSLVVLLVPLICWCAKKKSRCQRGHLGISSATKYAPLQTGLLVRDQPSTFHLKLAEMLTAEGRPNWKQLAAELGLPWGEIETLAVDKCNAAERMLGTWQTKNTATVDRLHGACIKINREDVASYIAKNLTTETSTVV